jgi:hypothetical protein
MDHVMADAHSSLIWYSSLGFLTHIVLLGEGVSLMPYLQLGGPGANFCLALTL